MEVSEAIFSLREDKRQRTFKVAFVHFPVFGSVYSRVQITTGCEGESKRMRSACDSS